MRDPDVVGMSGRAWKATVTAEDRARGGIGAWLTHCPASHPFWTWHYVGMVHLRGRVDGRPARIDFPGATHEVLVISLNPDGDATHLDRFDAREKQQFLSPLDVVHQVVLPSDEAAEEMLELIARACCSGILVPDSDHRARWAHVLNTTAEHFRLDGHPDG